MRAAALSASCLAASLAVGCASGGLPVTHYYTLSQPGTGGVEKTVAGDDAGREASDGWALAVESLEVATPYDQDRLVYRERTEATEVGFYAYHRWAAPVGRLAQTALIEGLAGTPGIAAIRARGSNADFDAVLAGRIVYIEEVGAGAQEARASIELTLRGADGDALWSSSFADAEPGPFADGGDVARALHRIFQRLIDAAGDRLARTLAENHP